MVRKIVTLMMAVVMLGVAAYAFAGAAGPTYTPFQGSQKNIAVNAETDFTYIGAWGMDTPGNPGYIVLKGSSTGTVYPYYLWVDNLGKLRMASYAVLSVYTSFPSGDWTVGPGFAGIVVGSQS